MTGSYRQYSFTFNFLIQDPVFGYDFVDYVDSPLPDKGFSHGTHMAGIIAMQANNQICGVGIAPLATLGGNVFSSQSNSSLSHFFKFSTFMTFTYL